MPRVYVSSTRLDLELERKAIIDWLVARGHQPVHSYTASGETVRDSCLADVSGCDAYVLVLSHRLGHVPADNNPDGLSITELVRAVSLAVIPASDAAAGEPDHQGPGRVPPGTG